MNTCPSRSPVLEDNASLGRSPAHRRSTSHWHSPHLSGEGHYTRCVPDAQILLGRFLTTPIPEEMADIVE